MSKKDYETFIDLWKTKDKNVSFKYNPSWYISIRSFRKCKFRKSITKRGRPMEKTITTNYLKRLKDNYTNYFLTSDPNPHVYRINSGSNDVNSYMEIIRVINSKMED